MHAFGLFSSPWLRGVTSWHHHVCTLQGVVVAMLGFRTRVRGYENYAKGKELGAVSHPKP